MKQNKSYQDIVNHFKDIQTVMIEADNLTVRVTGYDNENDFDAMRVKYNHSEVATEVAEKISYFIGV
jgi:hypothetical protein